jgi:hypothetical protein
MEPNKEPREEPRPKAEEKARKPYAKPQLVEYGPVERLTRGINSVRADGPVGFLHKH